MSLAQVLQFYAPLVGLLALSFWVGKLTQQVLDLRTRVKNLEDGQNGGTGATAKFARIEEQVKTIFVTLERMEHGQQAIQAQLAAAANRRLPERE